MGLRASLSLRAQAAQELHASAAEGGLLNRLLRAAWLCTALLSKAKVGATCSCATTLSTCGHLALAAQQCC